MIANSEQFIAPDHLPTSVAERKPAVRNGKRATLYRMKRHNEWLTEAEVRMRFAQLNPAKPKTTTLVRVKA